MSFPDSRHHLPSPEEDLLLFSLTEKVFSTPHALLSQIKIPVKSTSRRRETPLRSSDPGFY